LGKIGLAAAPSTGFRACPVPRRADGDLAVPLWRRTAHVWRPAYGCRPKTASCPSVPMYTFPFATVGVVNLVNTAGNAPR
jgi:hypothetical protein